MKLLHFLGLSIIINQCISETQSSPYINAIFNFGDSISDTGNLLISSSSSFQNIGKLPYGQTFFGRPTGRCSDGRLIVDFFAEAFGLPYLPPYLSLTQDSENYRGGVNFAVAGATALEQVMPNIFTNASLSVQLGWFKKIKPSLCASERDCKRFLKKALFLVGEIGGNDYNYRLFGGETIQQAEALIPPVVEAITNAVVELVEEGATKLVVPGNFPIGCSVIYLTMFQSTNKSDYDSIGCLKAFNAFSELHNSKLKLSLETLRLKYPHANIIYADYYGATMQFILAPERYGLEKETMLMACCGGGGRYNYNVSAKCGSSGGTVCDDPLSFANWDGVHYTEAAYRIISEGLLDGPFTTPTLITYSSPLVNVIWDSLWC